MGKEKTSKGILFVLKVFVITKQEQILAIAKYINVFSIAKSLLKCKITNKKDKQRHLGFCSLYLLNV